eukprot:TRINITY_DN20959_c0_g1_i1.p1 TRINITY_DN20959_c0_g1~~TRINITY_DN20959_c0_g1_i1.p1  ORF type:complete len:1258 (+),score=306.48 TRINITY_DN20959_c0_g1_i1:64-3837(+)
MQKQKPKKELQFLNSRIPANSLSCFTIEGQKTICFQVIKELALSREDLSKHGSSDEKCEWLLDIMGHSLSLPIDNDKDVNNMNATLDIFEAWMQLSESFSIPKAIKGQKSPVFLRLMIEKVSEIILNESVATTLFQKHVILSHRALIILHRLARERGSKMTKLTWDRLLRVLLFVTDKLLSGPLNVLSVGNVVSPLPERILFDTFLRCPLMMSQFSQLMIIGASKWTHRLSLAETLRMLFSKLSKSVFRRLWGKVDLRGKRIDTLKSVEVKLLWDNTLTQNIGKFGTRRICSLAARFDSQDKFECSDKKLLFLWEQLRRVIGLRTNVPEVRLELLDCIADACDSMLALLSRRTSISPGEIFKVPHPPTASQILGIFGTCLFEAAFDVNDEFVLSRASALGTLCRIVGQCCLRGRGEQIPGVHFVRFIAALSAALKEGNNECVVAILRNSEGIFGMKHEGFRVLLPLFQHNITKYMVKRIDDGALTQTSSKRSKIFMSQSSSTEEFEGLEEDETLRRACVTCLLGMFAVPTHFQSSNTQGIFFASATPDRHKRLIEGKLGGGQRRTSVIEAPSPRITDSDVSVFLNENAAEKQFENMSHLRGSVNRSITSALNAETDSLNLQMLLWILLCKVVDDCEVAPAVSEIALDLIQSHIKIDSPWCSDVLATALKVCGALAPLYEPISASSPMIVPTLIKALVQFARQTAEHRRMNRSISSDIDYDGLCALSLNVIGQWLLACPSILEVKIDAAEIMEAVVYCADSSNECSVKAPDRALRAEGRALMSKIMRRVGVVSPDSLGPSNVDCHISESHVLRYIDRQLGGSGNWEDWKWPKSLDSRIRGIMIGGSVVLTMIEVPYGHLSDHTQSTDESLASIICILRDEFGKHCWEVGAKPLTKINAIRQPDMLEDQVEVLDIPEDPLEDVLHKVISDSLSKPWEKNRDSNKDIAERFCREDTSKNQIESDELMPLPEPTPSSNVHHPPPKAWLRRFLAHYGFVLSDNKRLDSLPIISSIESNELTNTQSLIQKLDDAPIRDVFEVTLHYLEPNTETMEAHEVVDFEASLEGLSEEHIEQCRGRQGVFMDFVKSLGWEVDLKKHRGYRGSLPDDCEGKTHYYCQEDTEMVFHALPWSKGNTQAPIPQLPVQIVWNDTDQRWWPGSLHWHDLGLPRSRAALIVDRLPASLFQVRLWEEVPSEPTIGPLLTGTVMGARALGHLVRITVLNMLKSLQTGSQARRWSADRTRILSSLSSSADGEILENLFV